MYAEQTMRLYKQNLPQQTGGVRRTRRTRHLHGEYRWAKYQYEIASKPNPRTTIQKPTLNTQAYDTRERDEVNFPGDTNLRVNKESDIYPKLNAFKDATDAYKLPPNWNKAAILVRQHDSAIREVRQITPTQFRHAEFSKKETLIGQQINKHTELQNKYCTWQVTQIKRRIVGNKGGRFPFPGDTRYSNITTMASGYIAY